MIHLRVLSLTFLLAVAAALPAKEAAADVQRANRVLDALQIGAVVEVMREESVIYSRTLAEEMIPGGSNQLWEDAVSRLYAPGLMEAAVRDAFAKALGEQPVDEATAFFESERGRRIVALEVGARAALTDEAVEETARQHYLDILAQDAASLESLDRFVTVNDLIEQNVVGAMNSNVAFYNGLADGGGVQMSQDDILADVWSGEQETREDTREWLYAYLLLAYQPLQPGDLDAYVEMSETAQGQVLNQALFAAFDEVYNKLAYGLGLALAQAMTGQDI